MKEINNLIYTLEIKYINNSGLETLISIKLQDNGLRIKSIKVGNVCITEETIKGRILSGKLEDLDVCCGYKFDYKNGENVLSINPNITIDTATSLIEKKKMESAFLTAELVLSSILRNDYRVVILNKGNLKLTKTIYAENEKLEKCSLQECIDLLKLDCEESFIEQHKKRVYNIDDKCAIEETQPLVDSDIKLQLTDLLTIINQHPQNYKDLIKLKEHIQKNTTDNSINEGKSY